MTKRPTLTENVSTRVARARRSAERHKLFRFLGPRGAVTLVLGCALSIGGVTEALDGGQEVVRLGPNVPMQELVTLLVENAQVHPLRVQIHAAIVAMLIVVESHHDPPC